MKRCILPVGIGLVLATAAGCALRTNRGTTYVVKQMAPADRLTVLVHVGASLDTERSTQQGIVRRSIYHGPYSLAIDVRDPAFTCTRFRIQDAGVTSLDGQKRLTLTYLSGMTPNGGRRRHGDGWIPMEHDRRHWVVRGIGGKAARNHVTAEEGAVDLDAIGEEVVFSFTIVSDWGEETRTTHFSVTLRRKKKNYVTFDPLMLE